MAWPTTQGKLGHRQGDILVALRGGTTDTPEAITSTEGRVQVLPYFWNPNNLAYEVATGGATPGANVNVTNFPAVQEVSGTFSTQEANYTLAYEDTGTYTYIGHATPGTATSAASWRIKRMTNATLRTVYADGDANFNNVWDNRASLSYS